MGKGYTGIFDTHAHMDDPYFRDHIEEVIKAEAGRGVFAVMQSGSELESSRRSVEMAEKYRMFAASVGIYPNETAHLPADYIAQLREMARSQRVCAIGEIGMDFGFEGHPSREVQERAFRAQLDLAEEMTLPVVIHDRDADEDVIRILRDYPEIRGAVHRVFSPLPYAKVLLEMGLYMGIGPQVTLPDSEKLTALVREMPLDRLLLETDAPFLPVAGAEMPALPSMIGAVADKIAEIRGDVTGQAVIDIARVNAYRLYHLSDRAFL